ncbi:MAG: ankyrin repeat domain-containing protein [Planctomycetota bacterium]
MNRSLLRAAAEGRARAVSELLAAGADPDAGAGWLESTPLHLAAEGGHLEVVKTLVRAVADTDALDELGLTPQDAARIEGQWRVERYLRRAGDR